MTSGLEMSARNLIKFCIFLIVLSVSRVFALLFPESSVLQLVGSLSLPIELQAKDQQLFFDWGFQMNYNFPYNVSTFYNVPIWQNTKQLTRRDMSSEDNLTNDYTGAEFYEGLENILTSYDFDKSCLLLSICELANYPFEKHQNNFLSDILTFMLTPTFHFAQYTHHISAQLYGHAGGDCRTAYNSCAIDVLSLISRVDFT